MVLSRNSLSLVLETSYTGDSVASLKLCATTPSKKLSGSATDTVVASVPPCGIVEFSIWHLVKKKERKRPKYVFTMLLAH